MLGRMKMGKWKRLAIGIITLTAVLGAAWLSNWLLSPLTVPTSNLERYLMAGVLRWYESEPGSHNGKAAHIGIFGPDALRDFSREDMAFLTSRGRLLLPASLLEPAVLGQVRDKLGTESAYAVLLKHYTWVGRNTVDVNVVLRSGFCINGVTLTLRHDLWGWRFGRTRPFYDF